MGTPLPCGFCGKFHTRQGCRKRHAKPTKEPKMKYYVHVHGPDDMMPMDNWEQALEEANKLNAAFVKLVDTRTDNDPIMYAVAVKVEG